MRWLEWNGLEIYEDGVYVDTIANQNLDGISYNSGLGKVRRFPLFLGQTSELAIVLLMVRTEVAFEI